MADAAEDDEYESTTIISVLAESNRRDRWTVAPDTSIFTVLARSFFDFRQAETSATTVEINVTCLFGKVTLVVPEGTDVQLSGFSFLASANSDVVSSDEPSTLPRLIVTAKTVFGTLCVRTPNAAERGSAATKDREVPTPAEGLGDGATSMFDTSTTPTSPDAADQVSSREPVGSAV